MSFRQRVWFMLTKGNDNPYILLLRKFLFYGLFVTSTSLIIVKKYKSKLVFTFQQNQQNMDILNSNRPLSLGVYTPTHYLFLGIFQRFYKKYIQAELYFPAKIQEPTESRFGIAQIPIFHQKNYKNNPSIIVVVSGSQGIDTNIINLSTNFSRHGFRAICIDVDDFYNQKRLEGTLNYIKNKYPQSKLFGVGVQYGANLLLNYAGNNNSAFNGIASIGNPLNVDMSQKKLQQSNFFWKNFLYKDMLKGRIQKQIQRRKDLNLSQLGQKFLNNGSIYQLDKFIYKIQGEQQLKDFKQQNSSINSLKKLKTNTLIIQSDQDPFTISLQNQTDKIQNSKCIYVETQRGGHNEWFQSFKTTRWINRPLIQYFKFFQKIGETK